VTGLPFVGPQRGNDLIEEIIHHVDFVAVYRDGECHLLYVERRLRARLAAFPRCEGLGNASETLIHFVAVISTQPGAEGLLGNLSSGEHLFLPANDKGHCKGEGA
jgi:hypothetical protein